MAPNAISNRIRGHSSSETDAHGQTQGVAVDYYALLHDRHSHLPAVFNNLTSTTTLPRFSPLLGGCGFLLLFFFLFFYFIVHLRRRSSKFRCARKRGSSCGNGEESEKRAAAAASSVFSVQRDNVRSGSIDHDTTMAKKTNQTPKKQKEGAAPAAVLRPQARTPTPHCGPSRTVSLAQGRYTGVLLPAPSPLSPASSSSVPRAVEAWRGIPYAQTTGGANRFRPPVALPPYEAVRANGGERNDTDSSVKADKFGPVCPSTASAVINAWEGEDCLNLNVYRPASYDHNKSDHGSAGKDGSETGTELLPVIIYVHGGAFNAGSGTERNMASFVSWAETPLLAVSFNYRVGALGFPSSVVAEREGCLNLGLRDQRMLFEWARDNIEAFGGDGSRVTIMGMSAGAHSVGDEPPRKP